MADEERQMVSGAREKLKQVYLDFQHIQVLEFHLRLLGASNPCFIVVRRYVQARKCQKVSMRQVLPFLSNIIVCLGINPPALPS